MPDIRRGKGPEERSRWLADVLGRYQAPLLRHARAVVSDPAAAQDVVQESFLRLLSASRPIENLSAWLHRVTHNIAVDHLRRENRIQRLHIAAAPRPGPVADPADRDLERAEASRILLGELERLTANERAVLLLKVREGKSYKEISAITGLSTSNVGYLIHRGLKKLTARLRASEELKKVAP